MSTGEAVASSGCSAVPHSTFHNVRLELGPKGQPCGDRADEYRVRVETSNCPDPGLQRRSLISCRVDAGKYSDEIATTDEVPRAGIELGIVAAGNLRNSSTSPGLEIPERQVDPGADRA